MTGHDGAAGQGAPAAFRDHDHAACRAEAMAEARRLCAERGARLTPLRARTLEILLESHRALGAYDVLERLAAEGAARQPPVAYRALDFLTHHGLAHRIEGLNAYVACACPDRGHAAVFMVCRACRRVAEFTDPGLTHALGARAAAAGFTVERTLAELEGLCPGCAAAGGPAPA